VFKRISAMVPSLIVLAAVLHAASALPQNGLYAQAQPGNGVATFSPASVDFGAVQVGSPSATQQISLSNTGTGPLGNIAIAVTNSDYTITNNTCPVTLPVGSAACVITVMLTPSFEAPDPGGIVVTDDGAAGTATAFLAGTGVEALYVLPFQMVFNGQAVGTASPAQQAIFTNTADGPQGIDTLTAVGNAATDFTFTQNCNLTIPAGGSCPVNVVFTPSAAGPRTADLEAATSNGTIVSHLTGNGAIRHLQGFTANILPPNDDGSSPEVPLPFSINFFGTTFSSLFVNNNGNVTFTGPLADFTPSGLTTNNGNIPIIAAYWADVDTTAAIPGEQADPGSPPSAVVTYGLDMVNGHMAFGVDYEDVGYYSSHTDKLNSFQLILIDRSDTGVAGAFDIEFNYDKIQWESGDASGGTDGLCGTAADCTSAAVGYSNGTGDAGTNFQLPGSFIPGALLDNGPPATALIHQALNGTVLGRSTFQVRNGTVQSADLGLTMTQAAATVPAGSQQTYTVTITNAGPNDATNVIVTNTLPNQSTLVSATPSQGTACTGTLTLTCNLGTVTNGGSAVLTIIVSIAPDGVGTITNSAIVASDLPDPNMGNNMASETTTIGAATNFTLTVTEAGTGTGTVTSSPAGILCPSTCAASFASGAQITLTAVPAAGSTFTGWTDSTCEGTGTCTFTLTAARTVTATFASTTTNFALTVVEAGAGKGTVTSAPAGINCPTACAANFASGTQITLTAAPAAGSTFSGWTDASCEGTGTCTFTLTAARTVTATFTSTATNFALTVAEAGNGTGTVTSAPSGIICPNTCSANFASGTQITLTQTASEGSTFAGWSGACTGTAACVVTMTAAEMVTATFNSGNSPVIISVPSGGSTTATTTPGGTAFYGLIISGAPHVTGTVQLTCSPLPALITCVVVPSTVVLNGTGTTEVAFGVQAFCTGSTAAAGFMPGSFGGSIGAVLLALMLGGTAWGFRRDRRMALTLAMLMLIALGAGSCGGLPKSPTGQATPPGTYSISLTTTLNGQTQTLPNFLTLVVK
jgi:uncharacterized repeat protein (TIGR01451 family)